MFVNPGGQKIDGPLIVRLMLFDKLPLIKEEPKHEVVCDFSWLN